MRSNLLPIAQTGFKYIAGAFLAFVIFSIFDGEFLAFISFILMIAFGIMYRNPERELPLFERNSLLSPVDGKVLSITDLQESEYAYKLEIDSGYLDVAILRTPMDSTLKNLTLRRGARLSKTSFLRKDINENIELLFVDNNSNSVKIKHQLKRSFDDINIDVLESQNLQQACRYGTMLNGTTVIYLPKNFRLNVTIGNELKASQTLLGYFS